MNDTKYRIEPRQPYNDHFDSTGLTRDDADYLCAALQSRGLSVSVVVDQEPSK